MTLTKPDKMNPMTVCDTMGLELCLTLLVLSQLWQNLVYLFEFDMFFPKFPKRYEDDVTVELSLNILFKVDMK